MLLERAGIQVLVYRETIDMRCGFEKLHGFCVHHMKAKMNDGHAFVFFGKNRSRLKLLVYDGSGLVLIAKRIERKNFMSLSDLLGRTEITMAELRLIFHGGVIRGPIFGDDADRLEQAKVKSDSSPLEEFISSTQRERVDLPSGVMNPPI